jgi:NAD(P)-dependent dehydrogenase (short-subunit alcohol dehydrogenase family)
MHAEHSAAVDLHGQVALVTGGGRGLGRAFACALAAAGAAVGVTARSADQLAETVAEIEASGGTATAVAADVTDRAAVTQVVYRVTERLGPIDLLVNNAGIVSPLGPLWEADPDEWWRSVEINLRSALLCSAAVLPAMVQRKSGRIINVASAAGLWPIPFGTAYVTSKAAMIRLAETLAAETSSYGVSVFGIHPGNVRTAMSEYLMESSDGQKWMPWVRHTYDTGTDTPIDLSAQLVLRLASGEADVLSGRFISDTDDLARLVACAGEIQERDLYTLRLGTLGP